MPIPETFSSEKSTATTGGNTDETLSKISQKIDGVADVSGIPQGAVNIPPVVLQSLTQEEAKPQNPPQTKTSEVASTQATGKSGNTQTKGKSGKSNQALKTGIQELNNRIRAYRQAQNTKSSENFKTGQNLLQKREAQTDITDGSKAVQDEDPELKSLVEGLKSKFPDKSSEIDEFLAEHAQKPIFPETIAKIKRMLREKGTEFETKNPKADEDLNNADDLLAGAGFDLDEASTPQPPTAENKEETAKKHQQKITDWCNQNFPNLSPKEQSLAQEACLAIEKDRKIDITQIDPQKFKADIGQYIKNHQTETRKSDLKDRNKNSENKEETSTITAQEDQNQDTTKKYADIRKNGATPEQALKELENDPNTPEKEKAKLKEIQAILGRLRGSVKTPQDRQIMGQIISSFQPNLKASNAHAAVMPLAGSIQSSGMSAPSKKAALSVLGVSYNSHSTQTGGDMQKNISEGRGTKQKYKMVEEPPDSGNWKEVPDGEPEIIPYDSKHPLKLDGGQTAYDNPDDPSSMVFEIPVHGSDAYKMNIPKNLAMKGEYTTKAGIYGGLIGNLMEMGV